MEKNKRIFIIVGILIGVIGISLAYFVGKMLSSGEGATTKVVTANIKNSELVIYGELNFNDKNMLPGHKSVSILKVTATGNNELIPFNIIWEGTNGLGTELNFTVYKTSTKIENVKANCKEVKEPTGGGTIIYETCDIENINSLGESIGTGKIPIGIEETASIAPDQFINSTEDGTDMYYYVIIEYPNLDDSQNDDMGQGFTGEVKVEPSETEPDIQIASIQIEQEDGTYKDSEEIPKG